MPAYTLLLAECGIRRPAEGIEVVHRFIADHLDEARRLGWGEIDLFGCYPDPAFALVRYDCMGAVTLGVLTGSPIAGINDIEIRYTDGLAARRSRSMPAAAPVWTVFPPPLMSTERRRS